MLEGHTVEKPADKKPADAPPPPPAAPRAPPNDGTTIHVTFHNDSPLFVGLMYVSDWRQKGSKLRGGGKSVTRPFDGRPVRVTFGAALGDYVRDGAKERLLALEFNQPGNYQVHVTGAAQHVRLKSVKDDDGNIVHLDEHLFASAKTFGTFMEGGVMAKPAKSIHVYE